MRKYINLLCLMLLQNLINEMDFLLMRRVMQCIFRCHCKHSGTPFLEQTPFVLRKFTFSVNILLSASYCNQEIVLMPASLLIPDCVMNYSSKNLALAWLSLCIQSVNLQWAVTTLSIIKLLRPQKQVHSYLSSISEISDQQPSQRLLSLPSVSASQGSLWKTH